MLLIALLELLWFSVRLTLTSGASGGGGGKDLLTPIPRWQESWTASQAHGTAMAMVVRDCLVVFLRSPSTDVYKPVVPAAAAAAADDADADAVTRIGGLRVERIDEEREDATTLRYAPSWFPIGSHTLCAMTGLAMDVEHICRVLQKKANDHHFVYQTSMTTHAVTQALASVLRSECLSKGSRPFGVQCMLAGCDDVDPTDGSLCLYSVDPTGSWQSWGRATAIGKFGVETRRTLAKKLRSSSSSPIADLERAVEFLLESWNETCKDLGMNTNGREDKDFFIFKRDPENDRKSGLYRVPSDEIARIMDRVDSTVSAKSLNN